MLEQSCLTSVILNFFPFFLLMDFKASSLVGPITLLHICLMQDEDKRSTTNSTVARNDWAWPLKKLSSNCSWEKYYTHIYVLQHYWIFKVTTLWHALLNNMTVSPGQIKTIVWKIVSLIKQLIISVLVQNNDYNWINKRMYTVELGCMLIA